ncbi:putative peptidyl-glycine alpha-amidating monooxygenase T19B4.1 [Aphelenchoides besseyi]|nr:putative peptidyl-glycine alpha-amidating monooxygenase T19B4.1 [Aphelenchoides besseyi]
MSTFSALNNVVGILAAVSMGLIFAKCMHDFHETSLWFSNIEEMERRISLRTESGFYASFFYQIVETKSLKTGLRKLIYDQKSEFPHVINSLERFNIYPEVLLAVFYRFLSAFWPFQLPIPTLFYAYFCFLNGGLAVTATFFFGMDHWLGMDIRLDGNYVDDCKPRGRIQNQFCIEHARNIRVTLVVVSNSICYSCSTSIENFSFWFGFDFAVHFLVLHLLAVFTIRADTHIWHFFLSKFGLSISNPPFETLVYLCHGAFSFLGYDFVERTMKNGVIQMFGVSSVLFIVTVVYRFCKFRQFPSSTELYLHVQTVLFGVMTYTTLRMKYILFPHMSILASCAFGYFDRFVGRYVKYAVILSLAAKISFDHYNFYQKVMSHEQEFYDPDTVKLMEFISKESGKNVYAGSMQLLAGVKCCTNRAITNHPHFEDKRLRDRTFRIYQMYARAPFDHVYKVLKSEKATHIIVENSICYAKSNGCALKDVIDVANGQKTESDRTPPSVSSANLRTSPHDRFCDALKNPQNGSFPVLVFENRTISTSSVSRKTQQYKQLLVQIPGYTPTEDDDYVSVSIKAEPGYIVKFEPHASADRVHHMLLYGCDQPAYQSQVWKGGATCAGSSHILYAWARNAPSLTLPENVGFAIGNENDPVQYIVLQIHYAHPFQGQVEDYSGVTMHLSDVRPANLAAVYLFVSGEPIPPRLEAAYNNMSCVYTGEADLHPFAFRTHTHAMGRVVSAYFKHEDKWQQIGKRNPQWPQLFQSSPEGLVIRKGDFMAAACRFDSHDKDDYVPMGSMGVNEMCNFVNMMFYRDANVADPFPYGAGCSYNEKPDLMAAEYPKDALTLLPSHPEWEHAAHQSATPFGVVEKSKVTKIGEHRLGQIAGLTFDRSGNLVVFHRGSRVWDGSTFDQNNQLQSREPIEEPVLLFTTQSREGLKLAAAYGQSQFYLPHGVFIDDSSYIYTTDVGSHQVIKWRLRSGKLEQVLAFGTAFEPGSDQKHFCKPAAVAVSRLDGGIFIADGYCNNRIVHYAKDGSFVAEWGTQSSYSREGGQPPLGSFFLPHDITLDESTHRLFVADRENGRVQIFNMQGDALDQIANSAHFQNVYSVHFCPDHGLYFIPGRASPGQKIEAFVSGLRNGTNLLEYSFTPKTELFNMPHIIRGRKNAVWVGEIDSNGGVLWEFEVKQGSQSQHMTSAELYGNSGDSKLPVDGGSSLLVFILVFLSVGVAGFVAYMRFRDVAEQNGMVDRTGFKPLRTSELLEGDESEEDDFTLSPTKEGHLP